MDYKMSLDELYAYIKKLIENEKLLFKYYDNELLKLDIVAIKKDKRDNSVQVIFKDNFTEQLIRIRDELKKKIWGMMLKNRWIYANIKNEVYAYGV